MNTQESANDLVKSAKELDRMKGISLLAKQPTPESLALVRNLAENDESVDVRYFARKALNIIKSTMTPKIADKSPLVIDLKKVQKYLEGTPEQKLDLLQTLINRHLKQAVPLIFHALKKESNVNVASAMLKSIGILGGAEAIRLLLPFLGHANPRLRANAIEALELTGSSMGFTFIIQRLSDTDNRVRANAAKVVRQVPKVNTLATLRSMSKAAQPSMQASAAFALQWFPDEENALLLKTLLKSPDPTVKKNALHSLQIFSKTGLAKARQILKNQKITPSQTVETAETLANQMKGAAEEQGKLVEGLQKSSPEDREKAILAAVDRSGLGVSPILIEHLKKERNSKVVATLLNALGKVRSQPAIPLLIRYLQHMNDRCRANAVEALRLIGDQKALKEVTPLLSDPNNRTRANAVIALKGYHGTDLRKPLEEMVSSNDLRMQQSALYAIRELEDPQFYDFLKNLGESKSKNISAQAKEEFKELTWNGKLGKSRLEETSSAVLCPNCKEPFVQSLDHWLCIKCFRTTPLPRGQGGQPGSFADLRQLPSLLAHPFSEYLQEPDVVMKLTTAPWLNELQLLGQLAPGKLVAFIGANHKPTAVPKAGASLLTSLKEFFPRGDEVVVKRQRQLLDLWPFVLFSGKQNQEMSPQSAKERVLFLFSRFEVRAEYLPVLTEEAGIGLADNVTQEGMKRFFEASAERHIFDQELESWVEETDFIGREEELEYVRNLVLEGGEGVLWLTGNAGIGKSAMISRLVSLVVKNLPETTLLIPYRFKYGNSRFSRESFLDFARERLSRWLDKQQGKPKKSGPPGKGESNPYLFLRESLKKLSSGKVIFILDGLDELVKSDTRFVGEIPLGMNFPKVTWLCVGRPEKMLVDAFSSHVCRQVFPGGLPPMRGSDIRALILERTGVIRKKILKKDQGKGNRLINPFIEKVAEKSGGLPIYINYVINDLLEHRFSFSDAGERLPPSLGTYHDELLGRIVRSGSGKVLPEVACLLATSREPLDVKAMEQVLGWKQTGQARDRLLESIGEALSDLRSILRTVRTPEDREGFVIFHHSLREHMENSPLTKKFMTQARKHLGDMALDQISRRGEVGQYLLRWGFNHLLEESRFEDIERLLLDYSYLEKKTEMGLIFGLAGEFTRANEVLPSQARRKYSLRMLEKALRADLHFLARHPECLFPCLWNQCWWYDHPEAALHYEFSPACARDKMPPWEKEGDKLYILLENWREIRGKTPGRPAWLRSLRPPPVHLGSGQWGLLQGHEKMVSCVAYSPDGKRIASAGFDSTIRIWDAISGAEIQLITHQTDFVKALCFSPDGRKIASTSGDLSLRLWNSESGVEIHRFEGHQGSVECVAFSKITGLLASGSTDKTIRLWNSDSGIHVATLQGHTGPVTSLAFSPLNNHLVSGSLDFSIRVWNLETLKPLIVFKRHEDGVTSVAYHPSGEQVVSGSKDRTIRIWDLKIGAERKCLRGHQGPIESLDVNQDGTRIISGSLDKTIRLWNYQKATEILCLKGHEWFVRSVAFSPDGRKIVSGSSDRTVRIWDTENPTESHSLFGRDWFVRGLAFSPDGRLLALAASDKTIRLIDTQTARETACFRGHDDAVRAICFIDEGRKLLSGSADKTVRIWDLSTKKIESIFQGAGECIYCVAISPDGKKVVCGSGDQKIHLWDRETGSEILVFEEHEGPVRSVTFSHDGHFLASGSEDNTIRIWEAASGVCLNTITGHQDAVNRVVFNSSGEFLYSGSADKTIRAWNAETGNCLESFEGRGSVDSIARGPDQFPLRVVARNGELSIESAKDGRPVTHFPAYPNEKVLDTHPSGRMWAFADGNHFFLTVLEGRLPPSEK